MTSGAANEYRDRDDEDVLGRIIQGRFQKNDYVTDKGRGAVWATKIDFPDPEAEAEKDGETIWVFCHVTQLFTSFVHSLDRWGDDRRGVQL